MALVEVVVAFAILAGALIMALRIISGGVGQLANTERRMAEFEVAMSEYSKLVLSRHAVFSKEDVSEAGIRWRMTATPVISTGQNPTSELGPMKVEIWILPEKGGRELREPLLQTIILARLKP
jgi:hypothetical protein